MRFFVLNIILLISGCLGLISCCPIGSPTMAAFPQSVTETHTKTTLVMPPSYQTAMISPPSLYQAPPSAVAPVAMPCAPPMQAAPCQPMQTNPCYPSYQSTTQMSADPCVNYMITVPPPTMPRYTVAIPQTPAPQYTIAIPQSSMASPQCSVIQGSANVAMPLKHNPCE